MSNIALNKPILEKDKVNRWEEVTNGITNKYDGKLGFAYFDYPDFLTVDLLEVSEVRSIRILLWDGLGTGGGKLNSRRYQYQLSTSRDNNQYDEIFRNDEPDAIGWQIFNFNPPTHIRYIRFYGLMNTNKNGIHIVQIEAHDNIPPKPVVGHIGKECDIEGQEDVTVSLLDDSHDHRNAHEQLQRVLTTLEKEKIVHPEVVTSIRRAFDDLTVLNLNIDSVRREILLPVQAELDKSAKLGKFSVWGFWVGIVGGILAIISIILTFIMA